ncbi:hypothetical protein ELH51_36395 (plasmid) [Rhizobium ruizarguesonis]|nr:hypothetical protein ELH51_36395 [Rhizobium ruizarguesonis]
MQGNSHMQFFGETAGAVPIRKASPERESRNLSVGATVKIAASKKLIFAPAKALKDALNK